MIPIITNPGIRKSKGMKLMESVTTLSYGTLFEIWAGMALVYGLAYFGLSYMGDGTQGPTHLSELTFWPRLFDSIYFSVITATSTGYGDIAPQGISKVLSGIQSISALFVFAVFVTKLVSHQQDVTLMEIHKLTFEDVFHNTREGFYICRRDFDHMIREAEETGTLTDETWENLEIAFKQLQTIFEEIPDFYKNDVHSYTIDEKREQLLLEAAHRTLHRINQLIDVLNEQNIDWTAHAPTMRELHALVLVLHDITPVWKERSPYETFEAFSDILQLENRMHARINKAVPNMQS